MASKGVIRSFTVAGGRKLVSVKPVAMRTAIKAAMSAKRVSKDVSSKPSKPAGVKRESRS